MTDHGPPPTRAEPGGNRARGDERLAGGYVASTIPLDPESPELRQAADWALATGEYVHREDTGVVLIPDTLMVEFAANGEVIPETWRLVRADGRTLYAFRCPSERAA